MENLNFIFILIINMNTQACGWHLYIQVLSSKNIYLHKITIYHKKLFHW